MMPDGPVTVPEHYRILAREMKRLTLAIRDSFAERPSPQGSPWKVPDDLKMLCGEASKVVSRLSECINSLPFCSTGNNPVGNKNVIMTEAIRKLENEVSGLIGLYHKLWQRPFPAGYIDGQPIMSEMFEDLLRDCLILFGKVVDLNEMSPGQILSKYGTTKITLSHTFNPEIGKKMMYWIDERGALNTKKREPSWFLFGILFGWLWGRRD